MLPAGPMEVVLASRSMCALTSRISCRTGEGETSRSFIDCGCIRGVRLLSGVSRCSWKAIKIEIVLEKGKFNIQQTPNAHRGFLFLGAPLFRGMFREMFAERTFTGVFAERLQGCSSTCLVCFVWFGSFSSFGLVRLARLVWFV